MHGDLGDQSGYAAGYHRPMEPRTPYVYLILRSEDKHAAKQLATSLLDRGIDVWFDHSDAVDYARRPSGA